MEDMMNVWPTQPTLGNPNQDFAIRQFCPARMEQEQAGEWGEMLLDGEEMEIWPHITSEMTQLPLTEVEQIVETFFNVECYEKDNVDKSSEEENEGFDPFHEDDPHNLSMIDETYYQSNASMMIQGEVIREEYMTTIRVDQGLELLHLLLACAEAVGCRDAQLAESILARVWPCVKPWGDSLQRVSHCFAMGLNSRLSLLPNVKNPHVSFSNRASFDLPLVTREEKSEAFSLLHQTTPYIEFGFMAANEAICEAAEGKDLLHIIDLAMEHTLQWTSLMRTFSFSPKTRPKVIRITGLIGDQDPPKLENSINGLKEEAISLGISLKFHLLKEEVSPLSLTQEKLDLREEEALVINSIIHLHKHVKESRGSLKIILQSIKKLSPTLLTIVEQDANHNGPFFLGRFLESLHYYSAIFDSIDASLPRNSPERMKIEKFHLAEEIRDVVAYEGAQRRERHERGDQWRRQLRRAGFQVVGLKCLEKAKVLVSGYGCDGYAVGSEKGCLHLGWKGRPIMFASVWQLHNLP